VSKVVINQTFKVLPELDSVNPESNSMLVGCTAIAEPVVPRQYAGALLENIIITGNTIDGRGTTLQCIFAMDGRIKNIVVSGNTMETDASHWITLGGVQSGMFESNKTFNGDPVPAILEPLRIGGEVYILSFKDGDDEYKACTGNFIDYRTTPNRKTNGTYLTGFDLKGFLRYTDETLPAKGNGETIAKLSANAAMQFGTPYREGDSHMDKLVTKIMRLSAEGTSKVVGHEGIELEVYLDQAGKPTIGAGHLMLSHELEEGWIEIGGELVDFTDGITMAQAEQLFKDDVAPREEELSRLLEGVEVNQNQFDALFSLMYNIGGKQFAKSTALKRLKAGDFKNVPEAMMRYNKVTKNGKKEPSKGLTIRRKAEADLFSGSTTSSAFKEQTVTSALGSQVFTGAAQIVQENVVGKAEVHSSKLESTTMQGILGMVVSWILMFLVSKGWFPESLSTMVQPVVVEGLLGLVGLFFTDFWSIMKQAAASPDSVYSFGTSVGVKMNVTGAGTAVVSAAVDSDILGASLDEWKVVGIIAGIGFSALGVVIQLLFKYLDYRYKVKTYK